MKNLVWKQIYLNTEVSLFYRIVSLTDSSTLYYNKNPLDPQSEFTVIGKFSDLDNAKKCAESHFYRWLKNFD